jgi:anti-sigma regulatory factor (Ser/Thr protein kinase)
MADVVEIDLPSDPRSAALARQELEPLRQSVSETRFGDIRLLVSELVAEAIRGLRNGRERKIRVSAEREGDRVRASVREGGGAYFLSSTRPEPGGVGWGPYLVARLSDSWGLRRHRESATVWFEISSEAVRAPEFGEAGDRSEGPKRLDA